MTLLLNDNHHDDSSSSNEDAEVLAQGVLACLPLFVCLCLCDYQRTARAVKAGNAVALGLSEPVKAMMMIIVCCCCGVSGFGEFEPPAPPPPFHCHLIGYQKKKLRRKRLSVAEKVNQRGREQRIQVDNSRARSLI